MSSRFSKPLMPHQSCLYEYVKNKVYRIPFIPIAINTHCAVSQQFISTLIARFDHDYLIQADFNGSRGQIKYEEKLVLLHISKDFWFTIGIVEIKHLIMLKMGLAITKRFTLMVLRPIP